jgi:signal transduction histidine kinase
MKTHSLTRRLTITVLVLEMSMGVAVVSIAAVHERHIRMTAFDTMTQGHADTLFGAVEDAEDEQDNVILDMTGISIPQGDVYRVEDEKGRVLGQSSPQISFLPHSGWFNENIGGGQYRLVQFRGLRIIDPGKAGGGIRHEVTVLYGARTDRIWREVFEGIRFHSSVIVALILATALLMVWLLRRELSPLYELADRAERVTAQHWQFVPPPEAKELRELRPLAEAIEAALLRLQRSFEQQRRFTSDAAHELKTEVAIARSSLQLLAIKPRTVEEYERGLAVCLEDYFRLERTVLEMLTYARVEHEGRMPETLSCELQGCVQEAARQVAALAEMRGVTVHLQKAADTMVAADARDCALLCSNLLMNAVEHTGPGKHIWIELETADKTATLTIRDEGEGIAQEDLLHIFEPFYRPDLSRNRKSGGTGLGLSICEGICRQVGGGIAISSELGAGTKVTVQLPLVDRTAGGGSLKPGSTEEMPAAPQG